MRRGPLCVSEESWCEIWGEGRENGKYFYTTGHRRGEEPFYLPFRIPKAKPLFILTTTIILTYSFPNYFHASQNCLLTLNKYTLNTQKKSRSRGTPELIIKSKNAQQSTRPESSIIGFFRVFFSITESVKNIIMFTPTHRGYIETYNEILHIVLKNYECRNHLQ